MDKVAPKNLMLLLLLLLIIYKLYVSACVGNFCICQGCGHEMV